MNYVILNSFVRNSQTSLTSSVLISYIGGQKSVANPTGMYAWLKKTEGSVSSQFS